MASLISNVRFAIARPWTLLCLALLAFTGCDGISEVELGDITCSTSPCVLQFGQINVNRGGDRGKVEFSNVGSADLEITNLSLDNTSDQIRFSDTTLQYVGQLTDYEWRQADSGQSFETNGVPLILPPGGKIELELVFSAAGGGHGCPQEAQAGGRLDCGEVVVASNDTDIDDREIRVPIQAEVGDSRLIVNPRLISFPAPQVIDAGTNRYGSHVASFTVENGGTGNMILQNISATSTELLIEDSSGASFPITVVGGGIRNFNVTWTPTSSDDFDAQISVTSNALQDPVQNILVDSEGGAAAGIDIDPCGMHFGEATVGEPTEILFDVTNTGGAPLTWNVSLSGVSPAARAALSLASTDGNPLPFGGQDTVTPGNSRTLKLVYEPTEAVSVDGSLLFTGNFGASRSCDVSAGEATGFAQVQPQQVYWSGVLAGETAIRSFQVFNDGRATLNVSEIRKTGDQHDEFTIADAGGFSLEPGEARRIEITYARQGDDVPAADTASFDLIHDGEGGSVRVFATVNHGEEFLPPTCDMSLSADEPFSAGDSVTFDASGSELNAGEWVVNPYQWAMERPSDSSAALSADFATAVSTTFDVPGTYAVTLLATAVVSVEDEVSSENVTCELTRNITVGE